MQIKVNITTLHKIPIYGYSLETHKEIPVAEGKVVLIECKPEESLFYKLLSGDILPTFNGGQLLKTPCQYLKPIIISETEKINVSDWYIHLGYNKLYQATRENVNELQKVEVVKILALPEHFSPKYLQTIIDGKMKDGDKVLVECENIGDEFMMGVEYMDHIITLNTSGHIRIYKPEIKMYTREEMKNTLEKAWLAGYWLHLNNDNNDLQTRKKAFRDWFEQNVK